MYAISRVLKMPQHQKFNSHLQRFPRTRLNVWEDVDIGFTVEKSKDGVNDTFIRVLTRADKKDFASFIMFCLGQIRKRATVANDAVVPAKTAYVTLTYDHNVADGAEVARLGDDLRSFIEDFDELVSPGG